MQTVGDLTDAVGLGADSPAVPIVISTAVICYTVHHYLGIAFFRRHLQSRGGDDRTREIRAVLWQRYTGVVLLGVIPMTSTGLLVGGSAADYGLTLNRPWLSLGVAAAGALVILVACALFLKRTPGLLAYYPEMRVADWSRSLAITNTVSWFVYLAAYELLFRGILVCRLVPEMGFWTAIFVAGAMYGLVHLPKHPIECSVVIPAGVLFGFIAAYTGSILAPFLAHAILASGAELLAVQASPERWFVPAFAAPVAAGRERGRRRSAEP